jgi:hypothetical protein
MKTTDEYFYKAQQKIITDEGVVAEWAIDIAKQIYDEALALGLITHNQTLADVDLIEQQEVELREAYDVISTLKEEVITPTEAKYSIGSQLFTKDVAGDSHPVTVVEVFKEMCPTTGKVSYLYSVRTWGYSNRVFDTPVEEYRLYGWGDI